MTEPRELESLTGQPDRRYVAPVLSRTNQARQRAWLACVLVLAIGLPVLVVTLGYNRPVEPASALAAPTTTSTTERPTTSEKLVTTESLEATTTSTTEAPTTTAAPTTTSTTAAPSTTSTTASVATTSTTAYAYQAAQVQAATTTAAPTTTTAAAPVVTTIAAGQGEAAFLACVRQRESGGNYGAVSPDGLYRGAYQFHQATWNGAAAMAGRSDLVGVLPNLASPADQDQLAIALYRAYGASPWGGYCA